MTCFPSRIVVMRCLPTPPPSLQDPDQFWGSLQHWDDVLHETALTLATVLRACGPASALHNCLMQASKLGAARVSGVAGGRAGTKEGTGGCWGMRGWYAWLGWHCSSALPLLRLGQQHTQLNQAAMPVLT